MHEKPPGGPYGKGDVIYADFENKKRIINPSENQPVILPEMLEEEAKEIDREIFENTENQGRHLDELAAKDR